MNSIRLASLAAVCLAAACSAADYTLHTFKKTQLTDKFWSEGATFADLNRDGHNDIVSGPYWWAGPDFKVRHEYYPATTTFVRKNADGTEKTIEGFEGGLGVNNKYSDNFFAFTHDFNGDGFLDILIYGFPGKDASWIENPGKAGLNATNHWKRHVVFDTVDNESPTWADLLGTGKPVIVCNSGGYFGYVQPDWKNPANKWTFHPISPKGNWQRFTHGLGAGDLNGDGRADILEAGGWWEQPASLAGDPEWKRHRYPFAAAGSQMYAYDVNGDGLADVITAVAAHGFGLVWHEQLKERDAKGEIQFRSHTIMNKEPNENRYGLKFAQLHAIDLVDMDGDGIKDIVTGKRFWAHGPKGDIEANADPVTYFFSIVRRADKTVDFVPQLIAPDVGVGVQVVAGDINGDKLPDVVVGNKKGTFVLMHETKKVSKDEWEKAQPKVLFPDAGLAALTPDKVIAHTNPDRAAAAKSAPQRAAGILPAVQTSSTDTNLYTRTFRIDPVKLTNYIKSVTGKTPDELQIEADKKPVELPAVEPIKGVSGFQPRDRSREIIQEFFRNQVFTDQSLTPPEAVFYNPRAGILLARASLAKLEKFEATLQVLAPDSPSGTDLKGVLPLGKDGKPLNLDFETGTLKDWTAEGPAFAGQPVKGEINQNRPFGQGKRAGHQGEFWIGGYEIKKDQPKGTLTSAPFKVTHPFAAFLLGGGAHAGTRVELVRQDTGEVFFKTSAWSSETMRRVVVDLQPQMGKEIFIRLVDEVTTGWGHVNFDDFRFYAKKPEVEFARSTGSLLASLSKGASKKAAGGMPAPSENLPPVDDFKFAGLKPEEAAREMTLPPGFKAHLFAGEPDVRNPIAFCLDDRGRAWVVEGMTYPQRAPEGQGKDRILVFEDTNGDHKFDKRTVFMEGLNLVSGIEYGFGGVWVGAAPYLYFIPVADGDSPKPAGKPQVVLEGFGYQDTHETLNTFRWGPDGWLYGCHGVFTHSHVKPAGAAETERQFINAGIWRYHPTKKKFEVFAEGTSNPWGMDFDEHGQVIMEGCVIPHLWHMIQGARYHRQGGQHYLPSRGEIQRNDPDYFKQDFSVKTPRQPLAQYVYDDIKTIGDHVHYAGRTPHAGNSRSSSAGGGHAHAGLMVYLGGSWPEQYRGKAFMNNIHGARMNMDIPERAGSGFVGKHGADFLIANDKASQMMDMRYDQDGSVYVIDWYDLNQCHRPDRAVHDYDTGRIFKIVYGDTKTTKVDLGGGSSQELIECLVHPNQWFTGHARRILQERANRNELSVDSRRLLREFVSPSPRLTLPSGILWVANTNAEKKLQLIWAMHVTHELHEQDILSLLRLGIYAPVRRIGNEATDLVRVNRYDVTGSVKGATDLVRAWLVQLACENGKISSEMLAQFVRLAREDKSPVVRLYLASAAQRLPVEQRWDILAGLTSHAEDAEDHNLPLMAWYAGEPLVAADVNRALDLALNAKLPNYLAYTARRAASLGTSDAMSALVKALGRAVEESKQLAILRGLSEALRGQRTAPAPAGWDAVALKLSSNAALRPEVNSLSAKFGSASALLALRETLHDPKADAAARGGALDALLNSKDPSLAPSLQGLLGDVALRGQAVRALANYDDAKTPSLVLAAYPKFTPAEKRDALATLASRPAFARVLVGALEQKALATRDLTAETVRQIRSLNQKDINAKLDEFWGTMRETAADKLKEIERYKKIYAVGYSTPGDAGRGRVLFNKTCGQCHTLFEVGGKVGPDLTGSARADLDYILHNIIDPNAEIPNDYRASTVEMKDDRSIMGIIKQQDEKSVTILTATEASTLPRNEIKSIRQSEISMMPEGLLTTLTDQEVRDLIFYLRSPAQVPLPKGAN